MKISIIRFVCIFTISAFMLSACSKSKSSSKSKTEIITTTVWKYSSAGIDIDNNGTSDSPLPPGTISSCDTDNTITFKTDNTGIVDEGATKCSASLPQTNPFTWSFKNNEADLNFSTAVFAGIGGDAKIIELTASKFTLSKAITMQGIPIPITIIVTLVP